MQDYETSFVCIHGEPTTYAEAMKRSDANKWTEAINQELSVLKENNTWTEAALPENKSAVSSKWVFKVKNNESNNVQYKARLVARGFEQDDNLDLKELYSPVAKLATFRIFVAVANQLRVSVKKFT